MFTLLKRLAIVFIIAIFLPSCTHYSNTTPDEREIQCGKINQQLMMTKTTSDTASRFSYQNNRDQLKKEKFDLRCV